MSLNFFQWVIDLGKVHRVDVTSWGRGSGLPTCYVKVNEPIYPTN